MHRITYFLPYIFVFIYSLYIPKDPDLGWHLKYGEYFFQHNHILRENIYSSTMIGFHWANGSWVTDILTYFIYHSGGFLALTITSAIIVTLTFFLFSKAAKFSLLEEAIFFPFLAYVLAPLNSYSFRGQQLSLLMLGILIYILSRFESHNSLKKKSNSKILWLLPVVFVIWANLQTESFLGIFIFTLWVILCWIRNLLISKNLFSRENIFLGIVLIFSFLATFINPFGWDLHFNAISHIFNPELKKINDYASFLIFEKMWWNQVIALVVLILGTAVIFYKKSLIKNLSWIIIPAVLLIFSFEVRRYAWPAYYTLLPFIGIIVYPLREKIKRFELVSALILLTISIMVIINLRSPFSQFIEMKWGNFCQNAKLGCSIDSAEYLQKKYKEKNIFTYYDWGGWLIWNFPEIKPSIDGRMHVWRDVNGYSAFMEYDDFMRGKRKINDSQFDIVYMPLDRKLPIYGELDSLVREGKWKLDYEDNLTWVIVRIRR